MGKKWLVAGLSDDYNDAKDSQADFEEQGMKTKVTEGAFGAYVIWILE